MSQLLSIKIDFKKVPQEKLYKGTKGTYGNITVSINDQVDQYGNNVSVWYEQSKEEREAKAERIYLGNGKVIFSGGSAPAPAPVPVHASIISAQQTPDTSDLPF
jgi:hypothetical protein